MGQHLATGRFEIGNAALDEETVFRTDLMLGWERDNVRANLNAYYASFSDFIFQNPNGTSEDELPVFVWDQDDATFRGLDGEVRWSDIEVANGNLEFRGFFDLIRASLDTATEKKLPLIPPNRIGISATQSWGGIALTLEAMRVGEQDDIPSYELPTKGYTDIGAHLEWQPTFANGQEMTVFRAATISVMPSSVTTQALSRTWPSAWPDNNAGNAVSVLTSMIPSGRIISA